MLLPIIAVACYLFGALGLGYAAYQGNSHHSRGGRIAAAAIAATGVAVHLVALVEEMLRLQREKAEAEASLLDSRHDLARQIERLDAQIDALVYDLYGLTEEEIAVVEGRSQE